MKQFARLVSVVLLAWSSLSNASTITFGTNNVDRLDLAGTQVEDGFAYTASGAGWELQNTFAQAGSALTTFFNGEGSSSSQLVSIVKVGGGTFTFQSLDFSTISFANNDQVLVTGLLNNVAVGSLNLNFGQPGAFLTVASGFSASIDELRISVTPSFVTASFIDNVVLGSVTAVPEPEIYAMMLAGLGILAFAARRRNSLKS